MSKGRLAMTEKTAADPAQQKLLYRALKAAITPPKLTLYDQVHERGPEPLGVEIVPAYTQIDISILGKSRGNAHGELTLDYTVIGNEGGMVIWGGLVALRPTCFRGLQDGAFRQYDQRAYVPPDARTRSAMEQASLQKEGHHPKIPFARYPELVETFETVADTLAQSFPDAGLRYVQGFDAEFTSPEARQEYHAEQEEKSVRQAVRCMQRSFDRVGNPVRFEGEDAAVEEALRAFREHSEKAAKHMARQERRIIDIRVRGFFHDLSSLLEGEDVDEVLRKARIRDAESVWNVA